MSESVSDFMKEQGPERYFIGKEPGDCCGHLQLNPSTRMADDFHNTLTSIMNSIYARLGHCGPRAAKDPLDLPALCARTQSYTGYLEDMAKDWNDHVPDEPVDLQFMLKLTDPQKAQELDAVVAEIQELGRASEVNLDRLRDLLVSGYQMIGSPPDVLKCVCTTFQKLKDLLATS